MEPSRLQNIFEQILYRSIRKDFTEKLIEIGRRIVKNTDATPEEAIEILRQFVSAAFQEALCNLKPSQLQNPSEPSVQAQVSEVKTENPAEQTTPRDPPANDSASRTEQDLEETIVQHILGIRSAAQKLVTQGTEILDRSLTDLDGEIQVMIDGTSSTIKELATRLRRRFQAYSNSAPSKNPKDAKDPSGPPKDK